MGQISLPRLEKINTTMSWESTLLFNKERWLSIKSFIFLKVFIQFIFSNTSFKFKTKWVSMSTKKTYSQFTYKTYYCFLEPTKLTKTFLNHYIYQYNNKYILLAIHV